jgi:hypothetical protein
MELTNRRLAWKQHWNRVADIPISKGNLQQQKIDHWTNQLASHQQTLAKFNKNDYADRK